MLENLVAPIADSAKTPDIAGPGGAVEDLNVALGSMIEHFNASGYGATARSWVSDGQTSILRPVSWIRCLAGAPSPSWHKKPDCLRLNC